MRDEPPQAVIVKRLPVLGAAAAPMDFLQLAHILSH
jgi:hypothetical protein